MRKPKPKVEKWKRGARRDILTPAQFKVAKATAGVRIRPVKCGKGRCQALHFIYAYQRIYVNGVCKEIYLGKCPGRVH